MKNGRRKNAAVPRLLPSNMARVKHSISVQCEAADWKRLVPECRALAKRYCQAALEGSAPGEMTVVLADDALLRDLNHTFRGKDKPTNILSFAGEPPHIGDLVLALETVEREAGEQNKPIDQHLAHLLVHGCLHLLGHDHESPKERGDMEKREIVILKKFGVPNPYVARTRKSR